MRETDRQTDRQRERLKNDPQRSAITATLPDPTVHVERQEASKTWRARVRLGSAVGRQREALWAVAEEGNPVLLKWDQRVAHLWLLPAGWRTGLGHRALGPWFVSLPHLQAPSFSFFLSFFLLLLLLFFFFLKLEFSFRLTVDFGCE